MLPNFYTNDQMTNQYRSNFVISIRLYEYVSSWIYFDIVFHSSKEKENKSSESGFLLWSKMKMKLIRIFSNNWEFSDLLLFYDKMEKVNREMNWKMQRKNDMARVHSKAHWQRTKNQKWGKCALRENKFVASRKRNFQER